jgi:hypothetical protein
MLLVVSNSLGRRGKTKINKITNILPYCCCCGQVEKRNTQMNHTVVVVVSGDFMYSTAQRERKSKKKNPADVGSIKVLLSRQSITDR